VCVLCISHALTDGLLTCALAWDVVLVSDVEPRMGKTTGDCRDCTVSPGTNRLLLDDRRDNRERVPLRFDPIFHGSGMMRIEIGQRTELIVTAARRWRSMRQTMPGAHAKDFRYQGVGTICSSFNIVVGR
jgi:hypothetical protein